MNLSIKNALQLYVILCIKILKQIHSINETFLLYVCFKFVVTLNFKFRKS